VATLERRLGELLAGTVHPGQPQKRILIPDENTLPEGITWNLSSAAWGSCWRRTCHLVSEQRILSSRMIIKSCPKADDPLKKRSSRMTVCLMA
jgi:hypothetical protein